MKVILAAVSCLVLVGCGAAREPLRFSAAPTQGIEGRKAFEVAEELGGKVIPEEYHSITLSSPTFNKQEYLVVPFRKHQKSVSAQELLDSFVPAKDADLFAFWRAHGSSPQVQRIQDLCAPSALFLSTEDRLGSRWMLAVSNMGQNFGLYQYREGFSPFNAPTSCKYALLVRSAA